MICAPCNPIDSKQCKISFMNRIFFGSKPHMVLITESFLFQIATTPFCKYNKVCDF